MPRKDYQCAKRNIKNDRPCKDANKTAHALLFSLVVDADADGQAHLPLLNFEMISPPALPMKREPTIAPIQSLKGGGRAAIVHVWGNAQARHQSTL